MDWGWGEASRAFVCIAPVDVDIHSVGFYAATPLQDLRPRAAAYLGTYLLSLLRSMERQEDIGIYSNVLTRAHTLACLELPDLWADVIRPFLPAKYSEGLVRVVTFLASEKEVLLVTQEVSHVELHWDCGHGTNSRVKYASGETSSPGDTHAADDEEGGPGAVRDGRGCVRFVWRHAGAVHAHDGGGVAGGVLRRGVQRRLCGEGLPAGQVLQGRLHLLLAVPAARPGAPCPGLALLSWVRFLTRNAYQVTSK